MGESPGGKNNNLGNAVVERTTFLGKKVLG